MKFKIAICLILIQISAFSQDDTEKSLTVLISIKNNDISKTTKILDEGFPVDYKYSKHNNMSLLHLAVLAKSPEMIDLLISRGANIYQADDKNNTPFIVSLLINSFDISELFIEKYNYNIDKGHIPKSENEYDERTTALTLSIMGNNNNGVKYLIEKGADVDLALDFLFTAVKQNLKFVVDKFANSEIGLNRSVEKYNNSTALFIANENNNMDMIRYLLDNGAEINARNQSLMTVFDVALSMENFDLASMYINEYSYDIHQLDTWNRTALFYFTLQENLPVVTYLFSKGANPNSYQYNSAHYLNVYFSECVKMNKPINKSIVKSYIDYGLSLNEQDSWGYTFFHNLSLNGDSSVLEIIPIEPSDLNIQTKEDKNSALTYSIMHDKNDYAVKLLELGADPNIINTEGRTALFYCVINENTIVYEKLIQHGALINIKDNDGQSIFDLECNNKFKEFMNNTNSKYIR